MKIDESSQNFYIILQGSVSVLIEKKAKDFEPKKTKKEE